MAALAAVLVEPQEEVDEDDMVESERVEDEPSTDEESSWVSKSKLAYCRSRAASSESSVISSGRGGKCTDASRSSVDRDTGGGLSTAGVVAVDAEFLGRLA